jgi:hypothetical protein
MVKMIRQGVRRRVLKLQLSSHDADPENSGSIQGIYLAYHLRVPKI